MNLGDVLDGMFRLFIRHWRAYVGAIAVIVVPVQLVVAFLQRELAQDVGILEMLSDPMAAQAAATGGPGVSDFAGSMAASMGVGLLVSPLVTGIACYMGARAHLGQDVDAGSGLRAGLRRYPSLLAVNLLTLLAVVVAGGILVGPVIALLAGGAGIVAALVLLPVGLLALGVIMVVYALLLVAPVAVMIEERGPLAAIGRSMRLVRARFWGVFGIGLLAWLVSTVVGSVLTWPFTLPATLFGGMVFLAFTTLGAIVAGVLSAPLMPNALSLLYLDLRVRAEGLDLEEMTRAVEGFGRPGAD